ncbi:DUF4097 family beta strand repeat-containing protein [Lentibacillus sp. L22]|uniref:DUF4097 family beta strand repeat-containing protein n=1 Tax=Lentibacillus TaxID=175304 RepID=UPI0022B19037|nr:DUF4097 family beta strand repeat-containing protein [Lentibacillus daqui]
MSKTKRLAILGIALLVIGTIGSFFTFQSAYQKESITEEQPIEGTFTSLNVQTDNATVKIIPTDDKTSKVTLNGKQYKNRNYQFAAHVKNEKLSVKLKNNRHKLFNFDFLSPSVTLTVYIPQKQYASLDVSTGNGGININHIQSKEMNAITSNGRINMNDLAGSALIAETDNGRINGKNLRMDKVDVQSDNGKVELRQVTGSSVKARTGNGKLMMDGVDAAIIGYTDNGRISLVTDQLNKSIKLQSGNGKIEVQTKTNPTNTTIIANTDNGKVNVLGKYSGSTVIGNGDHVVELKTDNGGITVTKGNK